MDGWMDGWMCWAICTVRADFPLVFTSYLLGASFFESFTFTREVGVEFGGRCVLAVIYDVDACGVRPTSAPGPLRLVVAGFVREGGNEIKGGKGKGREGEGEGKGKGREGKKRKQLKN